MNLDLTKVDFTNGTQKGIAAIFMIIVFAIVWWALPSLIWFFEHLIYLGVLMLVVAFVAFNYKALWWYFKGLSWKLTQKLIAGDAPNYMYRYHEYLVDKLENIQRFVNNFEAGKIKLHKDIARIQSDINENSSKVAKFQEKKASEVSIGVLTNKIAIDNKRLQSLLPKAVEIESNAKYFQQLYEVMSANTEIAKYDIDARVQDYELFGELNSAVEGAKEYYNTNTQEYKMFLEAKKHTENKLASYVANINNFEKQMKPMLEDASMSRTLSEEEGMKLVEEFKKKGLELKAK